VKDLAGKTAVITGAASGIGRALADRLAREGMKLVIADIDRARLGQVESELRARGAEVLALAADVARAAEVEALAEAAIRTFGAVHLACNNAGVVSLPAPSWEKRLEDWELVLGVNLWGVIHGIRSFVPRMLRQGEEGHVVNTASAAGLLAVPNGADYLASKHAVVSISESLHLELEARKAKLKISVLCPGFVRTRILEALDERSRGLELPPELEREMQRDREALAASTPPEAIAEAVLQAVVEERFYILPHPELQPLVEARMRGIIEGEKPRSA
jgi:NAD(P)-dependent dehydrogenase (short-subunit alcohol dehydrogenase family)